ncbi:MAG: BON domain-containing protein [Pseudomonadota bacterium]
MNKITMLALAGAVSAAFTAGSAFASGDDTSYQSVKDKAGADYKSAVSECNTAKGNSKQVCVQEAKVARARAHADAVAQYKNTPADLGKARAELANAQYELAKTKCGDMTGSGKADCIREAKTAQTAALSDAKAGTQSASVNDTAVGTQGTQSAGVQAAMPEGATPADTSKADSAVAAGTAEAQRNAGFVQSARENCELSEVSDKAACLARSTGGMAKNVVADTVITTKLKADLVRDPDLKAMDVHVETVKGVVMLSGFVPSKEQAEKAEKLARSIDGVSDVKSALKVAPNKD